MLHMKEDRKCNKIGKKSNKKNTPRFLCNPEPYPLKYVPWFWIWPNRCIQSCFPGEDVRFGRIDHLGALDNLPEDEEGKINWDADVGSNEIIAGPGFEDVEAVENDDHGEEGQRKISCVGLEGRLEYESVAIDSLRLEGFMELDVSNANAHPREQIGDGGQVLEPLEDYGGTGRATQICQ